MPHLLGNYYLESCDYQYENGLLKGFSKKYICVDLIYYEVLDHIESAIAREKVLKKWKREWKERGIKEMNPEMKRLKFFGSIEGIPACAGMTKIVAF